MKFHMGSRDEGEDEDLFTPGESVVAFIVSLYAPLKQRVRVKATKTAPPHPPIFPSFPTSPLVLDECAGLTGCNCSAEWPFPVPHPWSAGSCQGAPLLPQRAYYGIECIWPFGEKKNNGWRPFISLASSAPTRRTPSTLCPSAVVGGHERRLWKNPTSCKEQQRSILPQRSLFGDIPQNGRISITRELICA